MQCTEEMLTNGISAVHDYIEREIRPNVSTIGDNLKTPSELESTFEFIYLTCRNNPVDLARFQRRFSDIGYTLKWADDELTEDCLLALLETPYGYFTIYRNAKAFAEMAKMMDREKPNIDAYTAAEQAGDVKTMERIKRHYRIKLQMGKLLYFLITPIHAVLLGLRRLLRLRRKTR